MSDLHIPATPKICRRCERPIPDLMLDCPICLGAIDTPKSPAATAPPPPGVAPPPPPIQVRVPRLEVELTRRDNGILSAHMRAGEDLGKNILACHRFETVKRARAFVIGHLSGRFGQAVSVEFGGVE
jgi:hypothetical protein